MKLAMEIHRNRWGFHEFPLVIFTIGSYNLKVDANVSYRGGYVISCKYILFIEAIVLMQMGDQTKFLFSTARTRAKAIIP